MKPIVDTTKPKLLLLAGVLAIAVACFAAYTPAIRGGFVWDDDRYVTQNPLLTAPDGLYRIWFSSDVPSQYFPLVYTTFRLEHWLWGFNPMGYHVDNVIIHVVNALLLWLILRRLAIPGAWFASAVFAMHPVQVESVAWITERKNVLMLFFSLLSVLCWIRFVFSDKTPRKAFIFYAGALFFYVLSLYSKATACTLPAALLLILWIKRSPVTWKRLVQIAPFAAIGIGIGLVVMWWEKHYQGTGLVNMGLSPADKILIAGRALWFYIGKLFWPVNLTASYPRWHIDPTEIIQYAWPAAAIATLVCLWLWRERLGRGTLAAILFFAAMLFPMLGFFNLYTFVYTFVADHYQYAACIGPIVLVAAGGASILSRSGKNARTVILSAAGILLLTLGILTFRQSRIYTDSQTLWEDTMTKNPDSWLAHSQIAGIRFREGKLDEATTHLNRAIELASYMKTMFPNVYADFYSNRALISVAQDKLDEAVVDYQKSLEIFDNVALTHYRLGEILDKQGKTVEALVHFHRALEIAQAKKADNFAEQIRRRLEKIEGKK